MSRLTDLLSQVKANNQELGKELEREFRTLSSRLPFGLNFERHVPESVELPGRPVRKGDKVRVLPARGSKEKGDRRLYRVIKIKRSNDDRIAEIERVRDPDSSILEVPTEDLVVVAEFRDYIYPGLVSTGKVERGGDKPFHTVINAENFHALEALTFTHRGKIDAIYIDPPYNTGARDWKYNNDYVEGDDIYRHSKWLAMMERRLLTVKELLNPDDSVLIVTIDEKEYLRLGMLLEQTFEGTTKQMVTSVISPKGSARRGTFSRCDEYIFFVFLGNASVDPIGGDMLRERKGSGSVRWKALLRSAANGPRPERPNLFYPLFFSAASGEFLRAGEPLPLGVDRGTVVAEVGEIIVWPLGNTGQELTWSLGKTTFMANRLKGYVKFGPLTTNGRVPYYLTSGQIKAIENNTGELVVLGRDDEGVVIITFGEKGGKSQPMTVWNQVSHSATDHGTSLLKFFLPDRRFPFPKSLYAVEDALRFFVANKPEAVILDFFSGSGTTAHAVMRVNKHDGGRRQCISITNNEVAADEQKKLREQGLRPGDPHWEKWGICDYITKPRIEAAITGKTPDGEPIKGDYKFTDEFPMADGFAENAEFFTLTYETPVAVTHNHAFERIAPLLWLRAGSAGRRIDKEPSNGWAVVESYGLLTDLDKAGEFEKAIEATDTVRIAYIVTDDERRFQAIAQRLPHMVEPVRLYEAYLSNFRFAVGRQR